MARHTTCILVVDDDDKVRRPLANMLETNGYHVASASCGREGIQMARDEEPELIICDVSMPEVDGYAVFEALQNEPRTTVIPFIFLSARAELGEIRAGLGLGADDYIAKPFEMRELLEAIRVRLERHHRIVEAAVAVNEEGEYEHIFVKDGDRCWLVEHESLRLLESEDNYVRLFFAKEKPLVSRTLNYLEHRLPAKLFFRANRKQIINLRWIEHIQPWFNGGLLVTLRDDTKVQMSRRSAQTFKLKMGI